MTREEAIQDLKDILEEATSDKDAVCYVTPEDAEALNMAIEALHREEAEAKGYCHRINYIPKPCENANCDCVEVVRCKDCRYFKKITERSDSGLCHRDIVASAWKENGYCSRGEHKGGGTE